MWKVPIVEEIHKIREEHARKFNFGFDAILKDIQEREAQSGREVVSFSPRKPAPQCKAK
jgi:hypothetical protein